MNLFSAPAPIYIDGVALWSQRLPGWEQARRILAGEQDAPSTPASRPAPELLPPNERRRAPDSVVIAIESALRACEDAGLDPASLPCVFTSARGDLPITDYMCATLASTPLQISPTRFHNSVHNAAAGYWSSGSGCTRTYTALCAGEHSFGAGLLEACVQAITAQEPVLLVAYDVEARGPVAAMAPSRHFLSTALVLNPGRSAHSKALLTLQLLANPVRAASRARAENAALVVGNASEACLPLLEALALGGGHDLLCFATPALGLALGIKSLSRPAAA